MTDAIEAVPEAAEADMGAGDTDIPAPIPDPREAKVAAFIAETGLPAEDFTVISTYWVGDALVSVTLLCPPDYRTVTI